MRPARSAVAADPTREDIVPLLRGVSHLYSAYIAAAAGVVLVVLAPEPLNRLCAVLYGAALLGLFAVSGLYHRWRWNPRWRPALRRLDHCTIFVFIAASSTPLALLVLSGTTQLMVLILAWAAAAAGVALSLSWIDAPRGLVAAAYVLAGLAATIGLPQILERLPTAPLILLAVGAGLYIVGAVVYALRRPNPWPRVFGFHELFHALVVAAATTHFAALSGWVLLRASMTG
ncbi:MAG: hemolysin III family protein [Solirubrobacterales bacterium]|nr:hemolysin III family protein [Solirubrobacterales bacterium]